MKKPWMLIILLTLTACAVPVDAPPPPTPLFSATPPPAESTPTALPATLAPAVQPPASLDNIPAYLTAVPENFTPDFCADTRALQLLVDLKSAIQNRDGELLVTLVSPGSGVGVRFIRNGNVITYFDNIKFIFETTYEADWGSDAGSGEPVKGSFQQIVLPRLEQTLTGNPVITCNQLTVGGATYIPEWPYSNMDYYSLYVPGTDQYAGLDWQTWAVGMTREQGKPMLAALIHFAWEP